MPKRTIAVDFDGVIHNYTNGWADGVIYGDSIKGAGKGLSKLVEAGYNVVIFSTRTNPSLGDATEQRAKIVKWMSKRKMHRGTHYHEIAKYKPKAMAYIDDRGIRFTNWEDIRKYFC